MIREIIGYTIISFLVGVLLLTGFVLLASEPRNSKWRTVRDAWLEEHDTCAACGGKTHLAVHHIRAFQYYPELELDTTNFMTLCEKPGRNCHLNIGHSGDWRAWNPHAVEDAALMLKRRKERKYER